MSMAEVAGEPALTVVDNTTGPAGVFLPEQPGGQPAQGEMPFAVVEGQPVTELPRDLYIPPYALEVFLEAFEGPLDLLLYLIRRQNLDILDIPIAEITRQYVNYIEVMKELQLELAGEYLLMAAMLAEIKSRMLLPRPESLDEEEADPRAELVRRLQQYERFKQAAEAMDQLPRLERDTFQASAGLRERPVVVKLPDVTLKEMLLARSTTSAIAQTLLVMISKGVTGITSRCSTVPCSRSRMRAAPVSTIESMVMLLMTCITAANQDLFRLGLKRTRKARSAGGAAASRYRRAKVRTSSVTIVWT